MTFVHFLPLHNQRLGSFTRGPPSLFFNIPTCASQVRAQLTITTPIFAGGGFIFEAFSFWSAAYGTNASKKLFQLLQRQSSVILTCRVLAHQHDQRISLERLVEILWQGGVATRRLECSCPGAIGHHLQLVLDGCVMVLTPEMIFQVFDRLEEMPPYPCEGTAF